MANKPTLLIIISVLFTSIFVSGACATGSSTLVFDFTPEVGNNGAYAQAMQSDEFVPLNLKLARGEIVWTANITDPADVVLNVDPGTYSVYFQFSGHRTVWEDNNNGLGYTIKANETTIIPRNFNSQNKDVFADAPWRVGPNNMLPILLMVKDATDFDYDLGYVSIYLDPDQDESDSVDGDILLDRIWYGVCIDNYVYNLYEAGDWYDIIRIDPAEHGLTGTVYLHVVFEENGGIFDPDYDAHSHLRIHISDSPLPSLPDWYPGDTHYHSSYTDNMVEFGNPIEATGYAGKTVGLNWITITDHSFDLDSPDEAGKWQCLKDECQIYDTPEFKLIVGEEVSTYNADGDVIHFLAYNIDNCIPGNADKPYELDQETWQLQDVIDNVADQGGVSYAAHPTAHPGGSEAWFLNRGNWTDVDYQSAGLHGLEFWNGKTGEWEQYLNEGLDIWIDLLLSGKHIYAIGGTDAHGDFNNHYYCTDIPYIGSARDWDSGMGRIRTYVYAEELGEDAILDSLKYGHAIMTDGPVVVFNITNEHGETVIIGDEIAGCDFSLNMQWTSTSEFGNIDHIRVYRGVIGEDETELSDLSLTPDNLEGNIIFNDLHSYLPVDNDSYIRINATTDKGYRLYTNPIFLKKVPANVTVADALIALRMAVRGEYSADVDVNDDGHVTALDALMILQMA